MTMTVKIITLLLKRWWLVLRLAMVIGLKNALTARRDIVKRQRRISEWRRLNERF